MKKCYVLLLGTGLLLPFASGCGDVPASSPNASGYAALSNSTAPATPATPEATASNVSWLHVNKDTETITLNITAAQSTDNNGFNFNGYSNGAMTVTVPVGWHIDITFKNKSASVPHSLEIVPYPQRTLSGGFTPAFSGSATPQPGSGITAGQTQHAAFTPDKAGKYAIVCAVPGHSSDGLWDNFVVASNVTGPSVTLNTSQATGASNSSDNSSSYSNGW